MHRILVICFLLAGLTVPAWAGDLVATWQYDDGTTTTINIRDDRHIRMDLKPDSYMLLTGDKLYTVTRDDDEWTAVDMAQISQMAGMFLGGSRDDEEKYTIKHRKAGKKETIAGYKGIVYIVEVRDGSNSIVSKNEVVYSKSKDVKRISNALRTMFSKMGNMMKKSGTASMDDAFKSMKTYGGILRYGKEMKLLSVKKAKLHGSYYQLPKGIQLQDIGRSQNAAKAAKPSAGGKKEANFFSDLFKKSSETAKEETKRSTQREVQTDVRKMFKSIFNKD